MPTIKLNPLLEYDFEDYFFGDTLSFSMNFYKDDDFTVPEDVTDWLFYMDIRSIDHCGRFQPTLETLSIGNGIEYGTTEDEIIFNKILESVAGNYNQVIRYVKSDGTTVTRESGTLIIKTKV